MPLVPPVACAFLSPLLALGALSSIGLSLCSLRYNLRRRPSAASPPPPPRALHLACVVAFLYTLALSPLALHAPFPPFSLCAAPRAPSGGTVEGGESAPHGGGKDVSAGSGVSQRRELAQVYDVTRSMNVWEIIEDADEATTQGSTALHNTTSAAHSRSSQPHTASPSSPSASSSSSSSPPPHSPSRAPAPSAPPFFLYRLLGNDMPPLQCGGQLLRNTLFALRHEPRQLAGGRRLWVLNQVVNGSALRATLHALRSHGVKEEDILIRPLNLSRIAALPKSQWLNALTAQNEARNFILEHGRAAGARWVLAFDGNQFITEEAWRLMVRAAARHQKNKLQVFKVPMYRVQQEQSPAWLNASSRARDLRPFAPHLHESQVAFRGDAPFRYRLGMEYGQDNKLELLSRVCGTGEFRRGDGEGGKKGGEKGERKGEEGGEEKGEEGKGVDGSVVDTGRCGCHREVGRNGGFQRGKHRVAYKCGYTVRLWYHPCLEVDPQRALSQAHYRGQLRARGKRLLLALLHRAMRNPTIAAYK